ncbi:hypothetical protein GCM10010277_62050 [Streptomyces longisporoflavus]|nr:hypothetical protein GCM10010277_62050 [Streptomyces longisporoflavus]
MCFLASAPRSGFPHPRARCLLKAPRPRARRLLKAPRPPRSRFLLAPQRPHSAPLVPRRETSSRPIDPAVSQSLAWRTPYQKALSESGFRATGTETRITEAPQLPPKFAECQGSSP